MNNYYSLHEISLQSPSDALFCFQLCSSGTSPLKSMHQLSPLLSSSLSLSLSLSHMGSSQFSFKRKGKLMESTEGKKLVSQGSGPAEAGSREAESSAEKKERGPLYPVRPLEPDCVIYLRTGNCRYGSGCRFNHPVKKMVKLENPSKAAARDRAASASSSPKGTIKHSRVPTMSKVDGTNNQKGNTEEHPESPFRFEYLNGHLIATPTVPVSPVGLPLRPDQPVCKYYSRFGLCKYGVGCQFDHPVNYGSLIVQSRQAPSPNDTSRNGSQ